VPQKRPTARDVETSPSLRRDLLSFSSAFGEPVTALHVVHTWPLGWTVGSIGGDALRRDVLSFGPAVGEPVEGPHVAHTWPLGWTVSSIAGHALRSVSLGCVLRPPWRLQTASLDDAPTSTTFLIDSTYFYFVLHCRSSGLAL